MDKVRAEPSLSGCVPAQRLVHTGELLSDGPRQEHGRHKNAKNHQDRGEQGGTRRILHAAGYADVDGVEDDCNHHGEHDGFQEWSCQDVARVEGNPREKEQKNPGKPLLYRVTRHRRPFLPQRALTPESR